MLRRVRARSVSSWRHGDRERAARSAVQQLADLAADAAGEPRRTVPDAGVTALADQLAVLAADAMAAGVPEATVTGILNALGAELGLRGWYLGDLGELGAALAVTPGGPRVDHGNCCRRIWELPDIKGQQSS